MIYSGGTQTVAAGNAIFLWITHQTANSLDLQANGGLQVLIGSGSSAYYHYYVAGADFIVYDDRWLCAVIDPRTGTVAADTTTGSPSATKSFFGGLAKMVGGPSKGSPFAIDAIRRGRAFRMTEGDLANGYATFAGAAAWNDAETRRYGQFQLSGKTYKMQGLFQMGRTATAVDFRDSNRNIVIARTPKVATTFNGFEVRNAGSRVDWTNISIAPLGTNSVGYFTAVANATINLTSCTFVDMGAFNFLSNTTAIDCIWRNCGAVTQGGSTITGGLFSRCAPAVISNLNLVTKCNFISAGTGYAVNLGTIAATQTLTWDNTATGYAATSGTTGNEAVLVNVASGQTLTINVADGASTPSVHNTGAGAVSVVAGLKTFSFTVNPAITGYEWRLGIDDPASGKLYTTELDGEESATLSTQSYSTGTANTGVLQIIAAGYVEYIETVSLGVSDVTRTINLELESNQ
jgi:hypothetical protein